MNIDNIYTGKNGVALDVNDKITVDFNKQYQITNLTRIEIPNDSNIKQISVVYFDENGNEITNSNDSTFISYNEVNGKLVINNNDIPDKQISKLVITIIEKRDENKKTNVTVVIYGCIEYIPIPTSVPVYSTSTPIHTTEPITTTGPLSTTPELKSSSPEPSIPISSSTITPVSITPSVPTSEVPTTSPGSSTPIVSTTATSKFIYYF